MKTELIVKHLLRLIDAQEQLLLAYRCGGKTPVTALDTLTCKNQWLNDAKNYLDSPIQEGKKVKKHIWKPPTKEEFIQYTKDNPELSHMDAGDLWQGYHDGGWIDTKGNPVKNWKMKLRTLSKFNKPKEQPQEMSDKEADAMEIFMKDVYDAEQSDTGSERAIQG